MNKVRKTLLVPLTLSPSLQGRGNTTLSLRERKKIFPVGEAKKRSLSPGGRGLG